MNTGKGTNKIRENGLLTTIGYGIKRRDYLCSEGSIFVCMGFSYSMVGVMGLLGFCRESPDLKNTLKRCSIHLVIVYIRLPSLCFGLVAPILEDQACSVGASFADYTRTSKTKRSITRYD